MKVQHALRNLLTLTIWLAVLTPVVGHTETLKMVKDINQETDVTYPGYEILSNGKQAFFLRTYPRRPPTLWRTDGRTTAEVDLIGPQFDSLVIERVLAVDSRFAYFSASDISRSTYSVWRINVASRAANAVRLIEVPRASPFTNDVWVYSPGVLGGERVFHLSDRNDNSLVLLTTGQGRRLLSQPVMFSKYQSGSGRDQWDQVTVTGERLYLLEDRSKLWVYEPSTSEQRLVREFWYQSDFAHAPISATDSASTHVYINSRRDSGGNGGAKQCELWRTDGTEAGTFVIDVTVDSVNPRDYYSCYTVVARSGNRALMVLDTETATSPAWNPRPAEIWTTNGDEGNKQLVLSDVAFSALTPEVRFAVRDSVFWMIGRQLDGSADRYSHNRLFRIDGQQGNNVEILYESPTSDRYLSIGPTVGNSLYLSERSITTHLIDYLSLNTGADQPQLFYRSATPRSAMVPVGNKLAFLAHRIRSGVDLHEFNRRTRQTKVIELFDDVTAGSNDGRTMLSANNAAWFCAVVNRTSNYSVAEEVALQSGFQLWRSNGSAKSTRPIIRTLGSKDEEGNYSDVCGDFAVSSDSVFYVRNTARHGNELWRASLSGQQQNLAIDIRPSMESSNPRDLRIVNNRLIFTASRGEVEGRRLLTLTNNDQLRPLAPVVDPKIVGDDGRRAWVTGTQANRLSLWETDATLRGTRLLTQSLSSDDKIHAVSTVGRKTYIYATVDNQLGLYYIEPSVDDLQRVEMDYPLLYRDDEPQLIKHRGQLYATFTRLEPRSDRTLAFHELWRIDPATQNVKRIFRKGGRFMGSNWRFGIRGTGSLGKSLYFSVYALVQGQRDPKTWSWSVWRTNNRSDRAVRIHEQVQSSSRGELRGGDPDRFQGLGPMVSDNQAIWFFGATQTTGSELWRLTP